MSLSDFKSPYGKPTHHLQKNTDNWLAVETPTGDHRYFKAPNWTYFEKDKATEITEEEFLEQSEAIKRSIEAEIERRRLNGGRI